MTPAVRSAGVGRQLEKDRYLVEPEATGDAWSDVIRRHDQTLRGMFASHQGVEIDHAGDGFIVTFDDAGVAVHCAIAIQRSLAAPEGPWVLAPGSDRPPCGLGETERDVVSGEADEAGARPGRSQPARRPRVRRHDHCRAAIQASSATRTAGTTSHGWMNQAGTARSSQLRMRTHHESRPR